MPLTPRDIMLSDSRFFNNTEYIVSFILNFVQKGKESGYSFEVLFANYRKRSFTFSVLVPAELISIFTPLTIVKHFNDKLNIRAIGEIRGINIFVPAKQDYRTVSEFPELVEILFTMENNNYFRKKLIKQYIVPIKSGNITYLFPTTVLGSVFYFPSTKFTQNLFKVSMEREILYFNGETKPPLMRIKNGYADRDALFLYLFMSNQKSRRYYEFIGKRHLKEKVEMHKDIVEYPFLCLFPKTGEWELMVRGIPIENNYFLVCQIISFDERKLLETDIVQIERIGWQGKRKGLLKFYHSSIKKSKTSGKVNQNLNISSNKEREVIVNPFTVPQSSDKSVVFEKKIIPASQAINIPIPESSVDNTTDDLTTVKGSKENKGKGKPVKVIPIEQKQPTDSKNKQFSLEIFKELMERVIRELGIKEFYYKEFLPLRRLPNKKIPMTYKNGSKRKIGVFFLTLLSGKKATVMEIEQKGLLQFTSTLVVKGKYFLKPEEVEESLKLYIRKVKLFKNILRKKGFSTYVKKPPRGNTEPDYKNWVRGMKQVLKE